MSEATTTTTTLNITADLGAVAGMCEIADAFLREAKACNESNAQEADDLRRMAALCELYGMYVPESAKMRDIVLGFALLRDSEKQGYACEPLVLRFYDRVLPVGPWWNAAAYSGGAEVLALWTSMLVAAIAAGDATGVVAATAFALESRVIAGVLTRIPPPPDMVESLAETKRRVARRNLLDASIRTAFPDARMVGDAANMMRMSVFAKPESITVLMLQGDPFIVPCDTADANDRHAVVSTDAVPVPLMALMTRLRLTHKSVFNTIVDTALAMGREAQASRE